MRRRRRRRERKKKKKNTLLSFIYFLKIARYDILKY
jgi:hypothetical protein